MSRTFHMGIDVRGMLNWDKSEAKRNLKTITRDDGTPFETVEQFRNALMDELANGHEVLPISKFCDNFDFKKGCLGHDSGAAKFGVGEPRLHGGEVASGHREESHPQQEGISDV